jgi:hypothetical protein
MRAMPRMAAPEIAAERKGEVFARIIAFLSRMPPTLSSTAVAVIVTRANGR